jgi:hypothetical protein
LKRILKSILVKFAKSFRVVFYAAFLVCACGFGTASNANAQQFRPFAEPRITEAQWQGYYGEVSTKFAKTMRDLDTENLQLFFNEATFVTYTFTKPGHPAHPAWITRLVVAAGEKVTVSQHGYYAGSETEFEKFVDSYKALNERLRNSLSASPK